MEKLPPRKMEEIAITLFLMNGTCIKNIDGKRSAIDEGTFQYWADGKRTIFPLHTINYIEVIGEEATQ